MSSTPYYVTGVKGEVAPRLEIRDLALNPYQWSLFIRAVTNVMKPGYKQNNTDAPSWKRMGGIHGAPFKQWSGDPNGPSKPVNSPDPDQWTGYCHHGAILFPTWHRVVVLLMEQSVVTEASQIAKTLAASASDKAIEWTTAATNLRWPFWDWTLPVTGTQGIPDILMEKQVSILNPDGQQITVDNPLFTYKLDGMNKNFTNSTNPKVPQWFKDWTQTYRWPIDTTPHDPTQSDRKAVTTAFQSGATVNIINLQNQVQKYAIPPWSDVLKMVQQLFTLPMSKDIDKQYWGNLWDIFSNTGSKNDSQPANLEGYIGRTVEQPHNKIHMLVGGYGHMSDNDTAGFDPIFYLHHCNVDRLYALWEYVYPPSEYWMNQGYTDANDQNKGFIDTQGAFDLVNGSVTKGDTDLVPFRKANDHYWTSDDVAGLQPEQGISKNYTYPTLRISTPDGTTVTIQVDTPGSYDQRAKAQAALQKLFGPSKEYIEQWKSLPVLHPPFIRLYNSPTGHANEVEPFNKYRQFIVVFFDNQSAYERSHVIELYLPHEVAVENKPEQPESVVASVATLKRTSAAECAGCIGQQAAGILTTGQMIIDPLVVLYLLERNNINKPDTTEEQVLALIKASFRTRVVNAGRNVLFEGRPPGDEPMSSPSPPPNEKIPQIKLFSAAPTRPDGPFGIYHSDFRNHGTLEHAWSIMTLGETAA
ncbi:common central domain of tyrosinase-domain-containing protein [Flagelloscypha sp. PMI_526]|nr:common central domain of tyrosinase-domain-containing protein [Flagelloscypha sp. PMI_526]